MRGEHFQTKALWNSVANTYLTDIAYWSASPLAHEHTANGNRSPEGGNGDSPGSSLLRSPLFSLFLSINTRQMQLSRGPTIRLAPQNGLAPSPVYLFERGRTLVRYSSYRDRWFSSIVQERNINQRNQKVKLTYCPSSNSPSRYRAVAEPIMQSI